MGKISKGGRVPVSEKDESLGFSFAEFDQSILNLDPEIKSELDKKGLAYRWINATHYKASGNFHKNGWRVYRYEGASDQRGSLDFAYGVSPEGYIIRGDLVLAVKPKEQAERYKQYLAHRATLQSGKSKDVADTFKKMARESGAAVLEGYEENE